MQPARAYDAEDPLGPGTVVAGQYRVDGLITLGGTSFVYRATDLRLARPVALKVLQRALGRHAPRFEREALATAALTHPSVVRLFDFGLLADRRPYLVFELVAGEPLSACLAREGALPPDEAARLMAPVVGALVEAHAAGIAHRDLKPANLLLQPLVGGPTLLRLVDFGIANLPAAKSPRLTMTGQVLGTPDYMAPEQALGQATTTAADIWAVGAILWHLLAGQKPFAGDDVPEVLYNVAHGRPNPLPDTVPERLRRLVADCLQRDPVDRPDAIGVLGALEAHLEGAPPAFAPPPAPLPARPPVASAQARRPTRWWPAGLAAAALVVAFAGETPSRSTASVVSTAFDAPAVAHALVDGDQPDAALRWIRARAPARRTAAWNLAEGLARLRTGYVRTGLDALAEALRADPALAADPRVVPAVVGTLRYRRAEAALALLAGPLAGRANDALAQAAAHPVRRARWRAVAALEAHGGRAVRARRAALRADLDSRDCDVRTAAVDGLVALGDDETAALLKDRGRRDPCLRRALAALR
ncbi:MAG: serine/threonine protein kinase [Myxococcales bacterium]|nr:serine/threonine protein kinase [Myxococcales bacterium]